IGVCLMRHISACPLSIGVGAYADLARHGGCVHPWSRATCSRFANRNGRNFLKIATAAHCRLRQRRRSAQQRIKLQKKRP
ncbi:MAG TPA: hypothetical protein PLF40_29545, partial [Kofleriaceae bacterium]|nr:hypothetical protein [Kofleriaceae bacterium]